MIIDFDFVNRFAHTDELRTRPKERRGFCKETADRGDSAPLGEEGENNVLDGDFKKELSIDDRDPVGIATSSVGLELRFS